MAHVPTEHSDPVIQADIDQATAAALRRYVRGAMVGFILLVIGLGGALYVQQHDAAENARNLAQVTMQSNKNLAKTGSIVAVDGCNRDFISTGRIRALLGRLKVANTMQYKKGLVTDEAYKRAQDFYTSEISKLVLPDCRRAAKIITNEPPDSNAIPTPRYPGDNIAKAG